jgi:hypothetical protein
MQGKEIDHQGETSSRGGSFRRKDQGHEEGLHEQMEWAMEIHKGKESIDAVVDEEEDILELDLEEEEAAIAAKNTAVAIFFSQKSYNPMFLFSNMLHSWGVKELATVEKLGDYCFKLEFMSTEEKLRVVEGGPWRHKGDALIVVHYDGLCRPSEVKIETIQLWIRMYDLPTAMMTEACGKLLGG